MDKKTFQSIENMTSLAIKWYQDYMLELKERHRQRENTMHTKKPWKAADTETEGWTVLSNSKTLAANLSKDEAFLIAEAPNMLKALHKIAYEPIGEADATHERVYRDIVEIARGAVAKVKGE
jgi:hypothetical protein